jgi:hypothetical protein
MLLGQNPDDPEGLVTGSRRPKDHRGILLPARLRGEEWRSGHQNSIASTVGPSNNTQEAGSSEPLPESGPIGTDAAVASSWRPKSWMAVVHDAMQSWRCTLRLVVLVVTAALCVGSIAFIVQQQPDMWRSVVAVSASVTTGVVIKRLGSNRSGGPTDQE